MEPEVETVHADATLRIVRARNVVVAGWADVPTMPQLKRLERTNHQTASRGECGFVNIIVGGTPKFSAEIRAEVERQTKTARSRLAMAHVIAAPGLVGAAVRAFINTGLIIARPDYPTKVFSAPAPAAEWMVPRLAKGPAAWGAPELGALMRAAMEVQS